MMVVVVVLVLMDGVGVVVVMVVMVMVVVDTTIQCLLSFTMFQFIHSSSNRGHIQTKGNTIYNSTMNSFSRFVPNSSRSG